MRTAGRIWVSVLTFCDTAMLLGACTTGGAVPETGTETTVSRADPWSDRVNPRIFEVPDGGYLFRLVGGDVCPIGGGMTDSEFACLLNFREPMPTEDGTLTRGIEFRDGMFTPSRELADPAVEQSFGEAKSRAALLEPRQGLEIEGFTMVVETNDEVMFLWGDGRAQFFIAEQGHTPFWTPRPEWIPSPY